MNKIIFCIFTALSTTTAIAQNFGGNPSSTRWKQVNTSTSRVIFPAGLDSQAIRISNIVTLLDSATRPTIGNKIRKWNIVLQNKTIIPNAYVRLAPVISELNMTPGQDNFSTGSIRWDDNLIIHEDRHMQQLSNFNHGFTKVFSFLLGQQGQLLANGMTIPNYFFEGDAVWQETLVSAQGRGRMPSFYNGFKALWLQHKNYSWMKLRSGSYKDYVPDHYPLGYQLVAYGYATYGQDFWRKVTGDAVQFKGLFYSFNKAIEKYSGKPYHIFRQDAMDFFKNQSNLQMEKNSTHLTYISPVQKNNVVDYLFPQYIGRDSILVTKQSYKQPGAFYLIIHGKEKKIAVKNSVIDDYFSYNNGKIVYASYQSDPRWTNSNYSVLQIVDIKTGRQQQLTHRSKYFSPDINITGEQILAVETKPNGNNNLVLLSATTGKLMSEVPNLHNYFFTQTKYLSASEAVSAVRSPQGKMALVKINLSNGETEPLTPFTFNVMGYPFIKGNEVYFSFMSGNSDKIFMVDMLTKNIKQITNNVNGVYQPVINQQGNMLVTAFTADGQRLASIDKENFLNTNISNEAFDHTGDLYTPKALTQPNAGILYKLADDTKPVSTYKKSFQLFNFHSARPIADDPEYGYTFFSDNILSSFSNALTYTYNRNEQSHTIGFSGIFAGWYPILSVGAEAGFNRNIDTAVGKPPYNYNDAKINTLLYIPLSFTGGKTNKYLSFGAGFNAEQLLYRGIGKNIFNNKAFQYGNAFISFSNQSRYALQNVYPRWAQSISGTYEYAFNFLDSRKFVGNLNLYFPGLFTNHSLLLQAAYQKRDTMPDIFSNNFPYSRGYLALSTRQMYKLAANYQLPLLYPDWGVGNIIFFQRVRANAFFDYTNARARVSGILTDIINRSTGAEIFFDTKIWNSLPLSFGVRYAHLLDTDLRDPGALNRWEIILPINIIP